MRGLSSFHRAILAALIFLSSGSAGSSQPDQEAAFREAQTLEQQGRYDEAFRAYLAAEGGECAAAALAAADPQHFMDRLASLKDAVPAYRSDLIRAELMLTMKNDTAALELFRRSAGNYPDGVYPVFTTDAELRNYPAVPFTLGPGSQGDNWLVQRFIALGAKDEALKEFRRVWDMHRRQEQFNSLGRRFALDYGYFLRTLGRDKEALDVWLAPWQGLDMERNPDLEQGRQRRWLLRPEGGASRKEYMRLSYGFIQEAGAGPALEKMATQAIDNGNNNARRTLAFLRLLQGRSEEALQLELEFIQKGGFDPVTTAYRRGAVYESFARPREAAAEYESFLSLPFEPLKLPDQDEEEMQKRMFSQALILDRRVMGREAVHTEVLQRLQRLYNSLGESGRAGEAALRQFEAAPALLDQMEALEQAGRSFSAAGREKDFAAWLKVQLDQARTDLARGNIYWLLDDPASAGQRVAAYCAKAGPYAAREWKERFRKKGPDQLRTFLTDLVRENPQDAATRLELLDLEKNGTGGDLIPVYESLLRGDGGPLFPTGKGDYNRTGFRNPYDLAYRLMRLYEKAGRIQDLKDLGLRVARAEKPFQGWPEELRNDTHRYRDRNDLPEDLNLCFSLLIEYSDDKETVAGLDSALEARPYETARRQLARRTGRPYGLADRPDFPWANIPAGVRVLASNENVLSLAFDNKYVYAGHPWGLAVYTREGRPVTRVALASSALALAVIGDTVWAGTPDGLFSVTRENWQDIGFLPLDQDLPEQDRTPDNRYRNNGVNSLAVDNGVLWIGTRRNIQAFDPEARTLQTYSGNDLGAEGYGDWGRFIIDSQYIWADGYQGVRRFDKKTQKWEPVAYQKSEVHLLGYIEGRLWGNVNLGEPLRVRPCLIDRDSREVKPVLITGSLTPDQQCINGPFSFVADIDGQSIFTDRNRFYAWDPAIQQLRPQDNFDKRSLPGTGLFYSGRWDLADGLVQYANDIDHHQKLFGEVPFKSGEWTAADLKNGSYFLGSRTTRSPRYQYPDEDWPEEYETEEAEGGLLLLCPACRSVQRVSSGFSDGLAADQVFDAFADIDGHVWLATAVGVDRLDREGRVVDHYSRGDGLLSNRVTSGAVSADRVYFASGWNDSGGGLVVFDPRTRVFTARVRSDGMPADKLDRIVPEGEKFRLEFLPQYQRYGQGNYLLPPPAYYDPAGDTFAVTGEPKVLDQNQARGTGMVRPAERRPLPYLGGSVLNRRQLGDATYLCGTRGLVIVKDGALPGLGIKPLNARLVSSQDQEWKREAAAAVVDIQTVDDLRRFAGSPNGYLRAQAVSKLLGKSPDLLEASLSVLQGLINDPNSNVRTTLIFVLTRMPFAQAGPLIKRTLDDPDPYVRGIAACAMARNGQMPDLRYVREIFEYPLERFGNLPFGADSTIGVELTEEKVFEALAPYADGQIFEMMLEHPLSYYQDGDRDRIFGLLGGALRRHPEAAGVLLKAYSAGDRAGTREDFSREVFHAAGKELLPVLHAALASPDRVVRSNAARACGAIGEAASVPVLIRALDLESGLSRASIVRALGELRAREALPSLVELYIMTRQDETRRAGHRMAQQRAQLDSLFQAVSDPGRLRSSADQLAMERKLRPAQDPEKEPLLNSRAVLEAVQALDIDATREFYFQLAGTTDAEARVESAVRLGDARARSADGEKALAVLRGLLSDEDHRVRAEAAVSLFILDDSAAVKYISVLLDSSDRWERMYALRALLRVKDPGRLAPFRSSLEKCLADPELDSYLKKEWATRMEKIGK